MEVYVINHESGILAIVLSGDVSKVCIGCVLTNLNNQNNNFLIANNTIRWKNSRGLLIKVCPISSLILGLIIYQASNGTIDNNIINTTAFGGINLMPEIGGPSTYAGSLIFFLSWHLLSI
jgi:hypothetical protein